jgi:ParB-like chromosome segregation protein Spo0J
MKQGRKLKALGVAIALPLLYLADVSPDAGAGLTLGREARAVVGAPLTPVSVAGVARRSTARGAAAASTSATAQQQAATAQQQAATAQQQAATAQQQQAAAARPAGAPPAGAVVNALPAGCKPETKSGVEYQNCGGVYYRSAFQGNNLVYVVQ